MWRTKLGWYGLQAVGLSMALLAVSCTGPGTGGNVTDFLARVQDEEAEVRSAAVQEADRQDARAVVPLGYLMAGEDQEVAAAAQEALQRLVQAVSGFQPWDYRRWMVADELARLLDGEHPRVVRAEALDLLPRVATEKTVRAIAPLPVDDEVGDEACRALQRIPGPQATQALIAVLDTVPSERQRMVIEALGARGDAAAVRPLTDLAEASDPAVSTCALEALARIGEPAGNLLSASAVRRSPPAELARIGNALVVYAGNRAARGSTAEALEIYLALLAAAPSKALRCDALLGVGQTGGAVQTTVLLPYLGDEDPEVVATAIEAMILLQDREEARADAWTESWPATPKSTVNVRLVRMLRFAEPVKRVALMRVVAARNVPETLDLLVESAGHPDVTVRQVAFEILASRSDFSAPVLENLFLSAARQDVQPVKAIALTGYLRLAGERLAEGRDQSALQMYRAALPLATSREARLAILEALTRNAGTDWVADVRPLLVGDVSEEAVQACIAAAGKLAAEGHRDRALAILREVAAATDSVAGADAARARIAEWNVDAAAPAAGGAAATEASTAPAANAEDTPADAEDAPPDTEDAPVDANP